MGEHICKWRDWQGVHLQNLQLNYKQENNHIKEWAEDLNQQFPKEDITDGQKTHEKMFNSTNY